VSLRVGRWLTNLYTEVTGGHRETQGKSISRAYAEVFHPTPFPRLLPARMARSAHSVHYVVEEKLAVAGTIMTCNLSERRSATILLISSGFCFRIAASSHALCVGGGGQANASPRLAPVFAALASALLSMSLASPAASAF